MSLNLSIGPAAGMVRRLDQVQKVAKSAATDITIGTISEHIREGNSTEGVPNGAVYHFDEEDKWSVNALGIPDAIAARGYTTLLPKMVRTAHEHGKRLRVSIASFKSPGELIRLVRLCDRAGVDEIEYNASCPNLRPASGVKAIPSLEPALLSEHLHIIKVATALTKRRIAVKISPVEAVLLSKLASVIVQSDVVSRVVTVNTMPNVVKTLGNGLPALNYRGEDGKIHSAGGLAGEPLRPEGVRVVKYLRKELPRNIGITGVGGIFEGEHAQEYLDAGADSVQIATAYMEYGEKIFGDVIAGI